MSRSLINCKRNLSRSGGFFDISGKQTQLKQLEAQLATLWDKPEEVAQLARTKKTLENFFATVKRLDTICGDLATACELAAEGDEFRDEAQQLLRDFAHALKALEVASLLGGKLDDSDALVTINAGAGGTESCDWVAMLLRMYLRFAETKGFSSEIFDQLDGDEAGVKNVTFELRGEYAYGLLKAEIGVHRLVRISPFDAGARRHTSFASVYVAPVVEDDIEIEINAADLRIDTYRASGAGGQHVNKTDSAVRITHLPSGVVVQSQTQRSQHQNREQAMKILKSRLYERQLEERKKQAEQEESQKSSIAWGNQIRSYVLHPYKLVKDHRTNLEHHNPDTVLDGTIEEFIHTFLLNQIKTKA